ncbi:RNA polymerase II mediator complex subunit [Sporothrix epigloea]|uniref:Mediator of RNA polymerase II transcription subunit 12 n=1 Tax=Sporothrix epigloea TaxID=1892477 RepID=A0ABP0D8Y2_9PEZI
MRHADNLAILPHSQSNSPSETPSQPLPLSQPSESRQIQQRQQGVPPAPRSGTPKPPSTNGTPNATDAAPKPSRSRPPICSNRGRASFGTFSWTIETPQEGASAPANGTSSTTTATNTSSSAAASSNGKNGSSLRASIFKKSSSLVYGVASSTSVPKDTSGTDKDGQAKRWHLEVPANIPFYVVPTAARRLDAPTAKTGAHTFAASSAQPSQRSAVGNNTRPSAGTGTNGGRSASGSGSIGAGSSSNSANSAFRSKTATGSGGSRVLAANTSNNRVQKPMVRYLDFNPWRGGHLEDRMNDSTVRMGQYDRLSNPQSHTTETGSARGWLPLLLRQKNSTMVLGQALALANALSREKYHISPASQFKLPPRVTVTDTRRETWLRDLTNAAIPLRKLSRTIPHGLRGKVLLEQCLLKGVPVDRAMWLARCVGAQELRAFKRKGTANVAALAESEQRWLKEWTLTVQQFVEAALVEVNLDKGTGEGRLQYAARFACQLYMGRLLDHDQFLGWMLGGLRNAVRLPAAAASAATPYFDLWLYIVEEYFHGIMQRRKTSVNLAVILLTRLEFLAHFQAAPISSAQVKQLLKTMVQTHPDAFVAHSVWPRYEKLLRATLFPPSTSSSSLPKSLDQPPSSVLLDAISTIRHRNDCLRPETTAEMDRVVKYLLPLDNALRFPADFTAHFAEFLRLDQKKAVPFVIRWCASVHRPGLAKVYLAARLISELCHNDAKLVTNYLLDYLSPQHGDGTNYEKEREVQQQSNNGADSRSINTLTSSAHQSKLQSISDQQPEGNKALYQLVGLLTTQELFLPASYMASLILRSRSSDASDIVPSGRPHVRLIAELPVQLLNQSTASLRANHMRRLGYDTEFESQEVAKVLGHVEKVFDNMATIISRAQTAAAVADATPGQMASAISPTTAAATNLSREEVKLAASVDQVCRLIEDRSRNVKMAVAGWLRRNVVAPIRTHSKPVKAENYASATSAAGLDSRRLSGKPPSPVPAAAPSSSAASISKTLLVSPVDLSLEYASATRSLIEKTDDLSLLSEFIIAVASHRQSIGVMALCADTINLHLTAFMAMGNARALYDKVMAQSLAITVGANADANTAFQATLPPGTEVRPLLLALPALAAKMPAPAPGSLIPGANRQPICPEKKLPSSLALADKPAPGDDLRKKHFDAGASMATAIQQSLLEIDQRMSVATYDADCSPLSDGRAANVSQDFPGADEALETMIRTASSGVPIDSTTMDTLFGTIAMVSQQQWRRAQPQGDHAAQVRTREDFRLSASLFARLRRFNPQHFDTIMVKWLKRLRTMRDRPAIGTLFPVLIVFGCLDLASLLATTADEQPRESGAMVQSPARNTWRTSYLQDVLILLSVPLFDRHPVLTCDERLRFRVFQEEAPLLAPAGIAALVRNAVAEMTLWRHHQRQMSLGLTASEPTTAAVPRNPINAHSVSRLLRVAAFADAGKAGRALAQTSDLTVRSGLWEMMTLAMTQKVSPGRPALEMLRGLDIFAADVGQVALCLVASPGPYGSAAERAKEADNLASLISRAVTEFHFDSLSVLHSLPADMATCVKDHAQARFLELLPTRKHLAAMTATTTSTVPAKEAFDSSNNFHLAGGYLNVVRTILLGHQQQQSQEQRPTQQHRQHQPNQQAPTTATHAESGPGQPTQGPPLPSGTSPILGTPPLDASVVDKLGELWCVLQEPTSVAARRATNLPTVDVGRIINLKHDILRDWLPALLSLILLHLPNRDALLPSAEGIHGTTMATGSGMGPAMGAAFRNEIKAPGSQGTPPAAFGSPVNSTAASMGFNMKANINAVVSNNSLTTPAAAVSSNNQSGVPGGAQQSRDQGQEAIYGGACIALASLYAEIPSLAISGDAAVENHVTVTAGKTETTSESCPAAATTKSVSGQRLALQSRLFDTALLFADSLSDEMRQQFVRALRDAAAAREGPGSIVSGVAGGDLQPAVEYILSCPVSASVYYPRLVLERFPQISLFGRVPVPSAAQRERSNAGDGGAGGASGSAQAAVAGSSANLVSASGSAPGAQPAMKMSNSGGYGSFFGISGLDAQIKRVRFGLKAWDAVSDPSPAVQDNDTAVNLWLLEATKVVRQRRR